MCRGRARVGRPYNIGLCTAGACETNQSRHDVCREDRITLTQSSEIGRTGEAMVSTKQGGHYFDPRHGSWTKTIFIIGLHKGHQGGCLLDSEQDGFEVASNRHEESLNAIFISDDMDSHGEISSLHLVIFAWSGLDSLGFVVERVDELEREFEMIWVIVMDLYRGCGRFLKSYQYRAVIERRGYAP